MKTVTSGGGQESATAIYHLAIGRFRGIKTFSWRPEKGLNVALGGGDVGKTTILDAIALLLKSNELRKPSRSPAVAQECKTNECYRMAGGTCFLAAPAQSGEHPYSPERVS